MNRHVRLDTCLAFIALAFVVGFALGYGVNGP